MDIKRLHQAIKDLRAELDRADLAIQRIEVIAAFAVREQQTHDPVESKSEVEEAVHDED